MTVALEAHDTILRLAVESHGGSIVKTTGDGLLARFDDPGPAVAAALDGQRALTEHEWPEGAALRARMAVHSGSAQAAGRRLLRACPQPRRATAGHRARRPGAALRHHGHARQRPPAEGRFAHRPGRPAIARPGPADARLRARGTRPGARLRAAAVGRLGPLEPAHPADVLRRSGARAGRCAPAAGDGPAGDAHRHRRHGQDTAHARGRRRTRRCLSGRRLAGRAGDGRRPSVGDRGGGPSARCPG